MTKGGAREKGPTPANGLLVPYNKLSSIPAFRLYRQPSITKIKCLQTHVSLTQPGAQTEQTIYILVSFLVLSTPLSPLSFVLPSLIPRIRGLFLVFTLGTLVVARTHASNDLPF